MRILAIDSGTTSTRVWAVEDGRVLDRERALGGARDVARGRDPGWLFDHILRLAEEVVGRNGGWSRFEAALAFGMLTSEHGLVEIPHLLAPIGVRDVAAHLRAAPDRLDLPIPFLLVPGVVCRDEADVTRWDFMRGEETEVAGLVALGQVDGAALYLSPGSHTKFIRLDDQARISWGVTTLSGELLWALSQETLLAGLADPDLASPDLQVAARGASVAREQGLPRALYTTRLLHRLEELPPAECAAFVLGAVAGSDLLAIDAARSRGVAIPRRVFIGGEGGLVAVYEHLLARTDDVESVTVLGGDPGPAGAWALFELARGRGDGAVEATAPDKERTR